MTDGKTTTEAAAEVSRAVGMSPGLSGRTVEGFMRSWPAEVLPPVRGGKRRWSSEHVARLRADVEARLAAAKAAG